MGISVCDTVTHCVSIGMSVCDTATHWVDIEISVDVSVTHKINMGLSCHCQTLDLCKDICRSIHASCGRIGLS